MRSGDRLLCPAVPCEPPGRLSDGPDVARQGVRFMRDGVSMEPPGWGSQPWTPAPLLATVSVLCGGLLVAWGDQLDQGLWGIILGIVAVLIAVFVPMYVEWKRRPRLMVVYAPDTEVWFGGVPGDPRLRTQIVQIRVVNKPMRGFPARWLLTHHALACRVEMRFLKDGLEVFPTLTARWSGTPQPLQTDWQLIQVANVGQVPVPVSAFNREAVPQTLRFDLPPDRDGEVVAVALKVEAHADAFGFSSESYAHSDLEHPAWKLGPGEYEVEIQARVGSEIRSPVCVLPLRTPVQAVA